MALKTDLRKRALPARLVLALEVSIARHSNKRIGQT
jgi:hypothetical protein